jgi:hypothetical protein
MSQDSIEEKWNAIQWWGLGDIPEPEPEGIDYRVAVAKRALMSSYEDTEDPEACITDLLADLRHLCARVGLTYDVLCERAQEHYEEEVTEAEKRHEAKESQAPLLVVVRGGVAYTYADPEKTLTKMIDFDNMRPEEKAELPAGMGFEELCAKAGLKPDEVTWKKQP